ncbi:hypothetical protein Lesp02_67650 [Lentzea sp. NBRC 105346]|uniref:nSTAND1 domain-containing NTPase n=1 Tax=Lentzea sp. NBRC 105346 TaxID=3032205 RepID=UPI0024A59169|nr:helix-turn-helix domain-containing protein [Lentzea sp. NBRC 105346]GLZ34578.1 hypothetical protein Lesp02_67650 [Lentzea sp. NBRC 105346]
MPRGERPLESEDSALLRFAADLRRMREKAGSPPYRELGRRAHYSAATLSEAAGGRKLPTLAVTLAYVTACGGDAAEWEERWREVAADHYEPAVAAESPYAGLAAFQAADADRFFGREQLTAKLRDLVAAQRFVGVFGASGSGKSSLLRAGLVPSLPNALVFTPTADPVEECSVQLAGLIGESPVTLKRELAADPANLWLRVRQHDPSLVLVVDQFEEVFTLVPPDARGWFIAALTGGPRVVLGVRADFYGHCGRFPELVDALAGNQVLVGPMTPDELRRAIVEPATRVGAKVETALVTRLVADVAGQAAALPLVSHALVETWRRRRGMTLSLQGYEEAGGVEHALARTAESVFENLSAVEQEQARLLFLRLIALGEGTEDTKRCVVRGELDVADSLLDHLAAARLITLDRDSVDLTHEALIRSWPRLRDWIAENRDRLRIHRRLIDATKSWEATGRDPDALYRGVRLAQAKELEAVLSEREKEFLHESLDAEVAELAEALGRTRRLRRLVVALAVVAVLLAASTVFAVVSQLNVSRERNNALALQAAAQARALGDRERQTAAKVALAGYRFNPTPDSRDALLSAAARSRMLPLPPAAKGQPLGMASQNGDVLILEHEDGTSWLFSADARPRASLGQIYDFGLISADRKTLVATSRAGVSELWDIGDLDHPQRRAVLPGLFKVVGLSGDGSLILGFPGRFGATPSPAPSADVIAVQSTPPAPVLLDVRDLRQPREIVVPTTTKYWASLRPDGKQLATIKDVDGRTVVEFWRIENGNAVPDGTLPGRLDWAGQANYSADGRYLVTAYGKSGTITFWSLAGETPVEWASISDADKHMNVLAFGRDDRVLLAYDDKLEVWDVRRKGSPTRTGTLEGFGDFPTGEYRPDTDDFLVRTSPVPPPKLFPLDLDVEQVVREMCARGEGELSDSEWSQNLPGADPIKLCP